MLGPAWMWWLSGGWAAKAVLDKVAPKPPAGARPQAIAPFGRQGGYPSGPQGGPMQPGMVQQGTVPQGMVQPVPPQPVIEPPPRPQHAPPYPFDEHMDARTEQAVIRCIESKNVKDLRGFAQSLVNPNAPRSHQFPIAAWVMRQTAGGLELEAQQEAQRQAEIDHAIAQSKAAQPAAPAPAPAPMARVQNGAAPAPPAAVAVVVDPHEHPEG
jgi:hypothetical protein